MGSLEFPPGDGKGDPKKCLTWNVCPKKFTHKTCVRILVLYTQMQKPIEPAGSNPQELNSEYLSRELILFW